MWSSLKYALLAMFAAGVLAAAWFVLSRNDGPSTAQRAAGESENARFASAQALEARQHPERVVFLGDSYTGGSAMGGDGTAGWPIIVANQLQWTPILQAVGGSGFVSGGQTNEPFGNRVAAVLTAKPNVIVVEGGHNDSADGVDATLAASQQVFTALHAGAPSARLVVIGPIWPNGSAPAVEVAINAGLRKQASAVGATFIDPIDVGWFAGTFGDLIGSDGTHPTDAGHRHIAALVYPALRDLRLPVVVTDAATSP